MVNVGKYTIHRSYVLWVILATCEYGKKSLKMIFEVIGSMGSSWHWNRYNMWIQNTMLMYIFDINVDALNNIGCFLSFNRSPLFLNSDTLGGKTQFEGLSSWTLSNSLGETSKSIQKKNHRVLRFQADSNRCIPSIYSLKIFRLPDFRFAWIYQTSENHSSF